MKTAEIQIAQSKNKTHQKIKENKNAKETLKK
jgi:hypothetical protein